MRLLWLFLILLLALPAAADTTTLIPLHYVQVSVFGRYLMPGGERTPLVEGKIFSRDGSHDLLPDGITAWTIDERRNALRVSGSEDGIADLKRLVQVLDVPTRQVRLSMKVVRLDAGMTAILQQGDPFCVPTPGQHSGDFAFMAQLERPVPLEDLAALASCEMAVTSNSSLHLLWPSNQNQSPARAEVMPRVNGDGTVTLYISRQEASPAEGRGAAGVAVLRRIPPGHGVAVFSRTLGTMLILRVQEVPPADEQAGK